MEEMYKKIMVSFVHIGVLAYSLRIFYCISNKIMRYIWKKNMIGTRFPPFLNNCMVWELSYIFFFFPESLPLICPNI